MLAFSHRHPKRRTVMVTLVAWMFALMAGIANACLPQDREPGHDGRVQSVESGVHEATCNDSWDAGASNVAKQKGRDSSHLEPAAVQAGAGQPKLVSVAAIEQAVDDGVLPHGPPVAIRFLRLRL
ncbi:MAG: hypothetical protein Q8L95_02065 [Burkholderiales bacterium]|nr:hypothetical protein [Burkholderiales bacterium]